MTLPLLRPKADAVAAAVSERKAILEAATFARLLRGPLRPPPPRSRPYARDESRKMRGVPDSPLDVASHSALGANRTAYRVAFERLMQVCPKS